MKNDYGKYALRAAAIYGVVGIALPFGFKYAIFENPALSNLSNGEWAGFLGSYVGGIFGGIGTLIAVYFTVKSSQQAQLDNKKDTDQRILEESSRHQKELDEERARREYERQVEMAEHKTSERTEFANDIADKIGVYITHISKYHYAGLSANNLHEAFQDARLLLIQAENEVIRIGNKLVSIDVDNNPDELVRVSEEKGLAEDKLGKAKRVYREAEEEYKRNLDLGNRLAANEAFFSIKTKLHGIDEAISLLDELEDIHHGAGFAHTEEDSYGSWIDEKSKKLISEFTLFKGKYIQGK